MSLSKVYIVYKIVYKKLTVLTSFLSSLPTIPYLFQYKKMLFFVISAIALSFSSALASQSWPSDFPAPKNFKAFPSRDQCRLEVVFERDDRDYDYYAFGLYENAATPIWLRALEKADFTKWPITVVNGSAAEDRGEYAIEETLTTFTPLIVDICPKEANGGKFLNKVIVKAIEGGDGTPSGKTAWQSDVFEVKGHVIPIGGVKITNVTATQQTDYKSIHGEEPPADVYVEWELHSYKAKHIEGFYVHVGPLTADDKHIQSQFISGGNSTHTIVTIENYGKPDVQRKLYAAVSIKTKQGAFTDTATCPRQPVVIYK
ncbi:hypothetical protein L7F22_068069 [Adiantum nelumboides]|nr:hypothetical protein [Adiantum nelumboides]